MKKERNNPIYDITPFTLLDYPDKAACILWFAGCNMRCGYCYNPDIVFGKGKKGTAEALSFLQSRKGLLDGVVMSGGECTLHKELIPLSQQAKALDMSIKIDTNGSRPKVLKALADQHTLDYVALDFKAPSHKFDLLTRSNLYKPFTESLEFLIASGIPFEVRTTVHSAQLQTADILNMSDFLTCKGYTGNYYLQHFTNNSKTIETLPDSVKKEFETDFSTDSIQVMIRESI
ncbi:anaerobic ribonucleoside-triphosphate reductase activating protein [Marivirga sp. S37H4]|uniref:Anaerobic ribonucleoside-triphosphate reductase activating protein n=1 Tax=Marivirga aurantiaca TaxID=2802615 RepID=A0A934WW17_9BACT|nr:anaerobic ribonucleoside-triphosphate reductase activating protein [Marivirga aurantiaca]MBK6264002.1 anaerobic ribonucleoside-triphosphate reductase activating protein [Marivirga aurantiaca]